MSLNPKMKRAFPLKLFFRMTFSYLLFTGAAAVLLYLFAYTTSELGFFTIFAIGFLTFVYLAYWSLTPIIKARAYLTKLLDMPRVENLKVEGNEGHQQVFKKGEWVELGELFLQLEEKLRRRTKAYLREATELEAVMNSLGSPIVSVTNQMDVSFMNSAFAVLFELDLDVIKVKKITDFKKLIPDKAIIDSFVTAFETKSFENAHVSSNIEGRKRDFLISMTPLRRQSDGSLYGLVASFSDETLKMQLDQKRMDFVANASHELRTPITAISTSISLLQKLTDPEDQAHVLKSLASNSDRLVQLTQELLDLSKLEGEDQEELTYEFCNLSNLTDEALSVLSHGDKNNVEVLCSVESFWFDESKVKQVLTNLIKNALIHTPKGTKVIVEWKMEGDYLVLFVKDEGQGVPDDVVDRVFERFYRVDKSRSRALGGSGIGLSIVKHIVNLHGGEVSLIKSSERMGSVFKCSFKKVTGKNHRAKLQGKVIDS